MAENVWTGMINYVFMQSESRWVETRSTCHTTHKTKFSAFPLFSLSRGRLSYFAYTALTKTRAQARKTLSIFHQKICEQDKDERGGRRKTLLSNSIFTPPVVIISACLCNVEWNVQPFLLFIISWDCYCLRSEATVKFPKLRAAIK